MPDLYCLPLPRVSSTRGADNGGWAIQSGHPQLRSRGARKIKIICMFSDGLSPNAQSRLNNDKLELKEYTKEAIRHRDGLEIVKKIVSKQFAHNGAHAAAVENGFGH